VLDADQFHYFIRLLLGDIACTNRNIAIIALLEVELNILNSLHLKDLPDYMLEIDALAVLDLVEVGIVLPVCIVLPTLVYVNLIAPHVSRKHVDFLRNLKLLRFRWIFWHELIQQCNQLILQLLTHLAHLLHRGVNRGVINYRE
jgi:hypothetical protein